MTISTTPVFNVGDVYEKMKTKTSNEVRYKTYFTILFNTLLDMFDYEGLPDTIPKRFLEAILHSTGEVFVSKINGDLIASHGTLSGEVDAYGLGTDAIAVCPTGEARGKRGVEIAYGINNDTATPDMLIYWISHLLGETDKSIKTNIIYSRLLRIPKVSDDKDKAMLEEILAKVMDGEPKAFASKNALDEEFGAGTECFELTDANKIEKLPYLTQFFEDGLKRFYNFYGQPMQNQNKRAQSISDEIHGQDSVSFIIPLQMLRCREALVANINAIFGTEITVKFSPLWELEYKALVNRDLNENGTPDALEGTDEGVEGSDTEPADTPAPTAPEPEPEAQEEPTGKEPEEITDLAAMDEPTEPAEPEEPGEDPEEEAFNIEEIATALGVSVEELKAMVIDTRPKDNG